MIFARQGRPPARASALRASMQVLQVLDPTGRGSIGVLVKCSPCELYLRKGARRDLTTQQSDCNLIVGKEKRVQGNSVVRRQREDQTAQTAAMQVPTPIKNSNNLYMNVPTGLCPRSFNHER